MDICVRNLFPKTLFSELRGCFKTFGKVTDGTIGRYKVDGKSRGLDFIEMPSNDHGQAAIAGLQSMKLGGNLLSVQEE